MVRDNRIKEKRWSLAISGVTTGSFVANEDDGTQPLNGEILEVNWASATGSVFLTLGDTEEEFFRRNDSSGTGIQVTRPYVFSENISTGSIANALHVPFVVNTPVWLQVAGYVSGTSSLDVNVKYR